MPPINPMRATTVGAAVTQEEVAFRLFSIIVATSENSVASKDILPLFAKCMIAVEKPDMFLSQLETYNIKPQEKPPVTQET